MRAFHSRAFAGRFARALVRVEVHATRGLLVPVRRLETPRAGTSNVVRTTRGDPSDGSVPLATRSAHSPRVRRARTGTVILAIEEFPGHEGAPSGQVRASRAEEVAPSAEEGADGAEGPQFARDGLDEFFHGDDGRDVRRGVAEHRRDVRERLHGEATDEFHERGVEHLPRAAVRVVAFLRLVEHRHRLGLAHEVRHHLEVDEEHQKLILVERGVQANHRPPVDLLRRRAVQLERGVVAVHATQRDVPRRHLVHRLAREQLVQIPIRRDSPPRAPREHVISQQRRVRASLVLRLRVPNRRRATKRDAKLVEVESKIREPSLRRRASIPPIFILPPRAHAPGVHIREDGVHVRRRHRVIEEPGVANQSLPPDGGDLVDAVLVLGHGAEDGRATETPLLREESVLAVRAVHVHEFSLEVLEVVRGVGFAHLTKALGAFLLATRDGFLLLAHLTVDGGVVAAGLAAGDLSLVHVLGVAAPVDVLGVAAGTVQLDVHLDGVVELRGRGGGGEREETTRDVDVSSRGGRTWGGVAEFRGNARGACSVGEVGGRRGKRERTSRYLMNAASAFTTGISSTMSSMACSIASFADRNRETAPICDATMRNPKGSTNVRVRGRGSARSAPLARSRRRFGPRRQSRIDASDPRRGCV